MSPYPQRILWFVGNLGVAILAFAVIKSPEMIWPVKLVMALLAGWAFGSFGFFAHELFHGSIVRNRTAQYWLGFTALMPFFIAPTFWRYWHNNLHHGNTQEIVTDPDAFPTLRLYRHSRFMKFMFPFTPGSRHVRSAAYFFFWFSFHVFVAQFYLRFRNKIYERMNGRQATLEQLAQIAIWSGVLYWMGPENLLWTFVIPLAVQNYFVMSYISTNHNLSPLTRVNDPLVNSLTVTNHPMLEFLHFNFGYHIEHHIFPTMSPVHAKKVHHLLKSHFPTQMKVMSKGQAMTKLYQTARIYKDSKTLINPESGATYPTL